MNESGRNIRPDGERNYLGVAVPRPRVAFLEFTSCEGCQLQILNHEAGLFDFLDLVEIADFREVMTERSEDYDIAFVEGCISRDDEVERLRSIRERASQLVAFGSCACFGGVNQLVNRIGGHGPAGKVVYGDFPVDARGVSEPVSSFVQVDLFIYGCPVRKEEVEKIVTDLVLGRPVVYPSYPVCMECKAEENICLFDLGEPCLGPVTMAGCGAWCPGNRVGCWGCRGPARDANMEQLFAVMERHGFPADMVMERLECFGGFNRYLDRGSTETG